MFSYNERYEPMMNHCDLRIGGVSSCANRWCFGIIAMEDVEGCADDIVMENLPESPSKMTDISKRVNRENWQIKFSNLTSKSGYVLKTKEWCDVIFSVGKEPDTVETKAHKIILSISSPVFAAMFHGDLACKDERISIVDIDPPIFELLLQYAYTDSVFLNDVDVAFKLYYAAKKYMFPSLMETCVSYLLTDIKSDTALAIYEFAIFHDESLLSEAAMQYSATNAMKILKEDNFTKIGADTIVTLFKRIDLNINTEAVLIDAVARHEKVLNSLHDKKKVVQHIRFLALTVREFIKCRGIRSVLSSEERYAILANLASPNCEQQMPENFNTSLKVREKVMIETPSSKSEHIAYRSYTAQDYAYRSKFSTGVGIETNKTVLIVGIVIATQVFHEVNTKFRTGRLITDTRYDEDVEVTVVESDDVILGGVNFRSSIRFDQTTRINFITPIELQNGTNYTIFVNFEKSGFYPTAIGNSKCELGSYVFTISKLNDEELDGFIRAIIFKT